MAARPIGTARNEPSAIRSDSGDEKPVASIFDIGSVATGDEQPIDVSATGDTKDGSGIIDPADISPSHSGSGDFAAPFGRFPDGRPRKRRANGTGSNRGSGSDSAGTSRKTATEVSAFVGDILYSLHEIGAKLTKIDELELSDEEAAKLGAGIIRVTEEYEIPMPDAKTMAWINLAKVMGAVYAPRVAAYRMRKGGKQKRPVPFQMPQMQVMQ